MEDLFQHKRKVYKCLRCCFTNRIYSKYINHVQTHYPKGNYSIPPLSKRKYLLCELRFVKIKIQDIIFPHYNINQRFHYPHGYTLWVDNISNVHIELKMKLFYHQFQQLQL
jgi:hypothetical protein